MCKQIWQQEPTEKTWGYLPTANYSHVILNQYQKVGQKPGHTPVLKKELNIDQVILFVCEILEISDCNIS